MMDDRAWNRLSLAHAPYWVMAAALNYQYASRFGYRFRFIQPFSQGHEHERGELVGVYPGWDKVMYFAELLQEQPIPSKCSWLLYLDSDAFVRETDVCIPAFLDDLARRYRFKPQEKAVIFAQEQPMEYLNMSTAPMPSGAQPAAPFLNTGVFLVRADLAEARQLFHAWLASASQVDRRRLWTTWPGEQGIVSELLRPGSYVEARSTAAVPRLEELRAAVGVVNMTEMNSPWGRFVQHSWGSEATDALLRRQALVDALLRLGAAAPDIFRRLVRQVQRHTVRWPRWDWGATVQNMALP